MNSNERNKETWTCADCCVNPCKCEIYPNKDNEREAFEKWFLGENPTDTDKRSIAKDRYGNYLLMKTRTDWIAWQAAKADSAPKLGKGVWLCTNCDNTESKEREVCCWKCSKGEMVYHSFDELRNSAPKLSEEEAVDIIHKECSENGTLFVYLDAVEIIKTLKAAGMEFRGDGK